MTVGSAPSRGPILVTGAAGFLGYHVARRLLEQGAPVIGLDNLNAYYDPALKRARLAGLERLPGFHFEKLDLSDHEGMAALFARHRFPYVVHLAAQAGVRHSLVDPHAYVDANLLGFLNVLEGCRRTGCKHLVYASTSSVYGANARLPFRASDNVDHPLSFYAATKKANEAMAHAYAHLYGLPATGVRFFTVYGPWGRPDMAVWLFTEAIMHGKPVRLFNEGRMRRDFTYVDDAAEGVVRLIERPAAGDPAWDAENPNPATSRAPWRIYNIGNSRPIEITEVVRLLEEKIGNKAGRELLPMQAGDVLETYADSADLERDVGFTPKIPIEQGLTRFVDWYKAYAAETAR